MMAEETYLTALDQGALSIVAKLKPEMYDVFRQHLIKANKSLICSHKCEVHR